MLASDKIKEFIKNQEGCSLVAYKPLSTDRWTIGYGCTFLEGGRPVDEHMKITQQRADDLLDAIVDRLADQISRNPRIPASVTSNEFDAVVSLVYNIGFSAFKNSPTGKLFYAGLSISEKFPMWNQSGGKTIPGLVARRIREKAIYDDSNYDL